ncbi:hypothetical protein LguiA_030085 [Lonicera macranthoides]
MSKIKKGSVNMNANRLPTDVLNFWALSLDCSLFHAGRNLLSSSKENKCFDSMEIHRSNNTQTYAILLVSSSSEIPKILLQIKIQVQVHALGSESITILREVALCCYYESYRVIRLNGLIPLETGRLKSLNELALYTNNLDGPIPSSILERLELVVQAIDLNKLSGYFPAKICDGGKLENLTANDNNLVGPIPKSLRNYSSLIRVRLDRNQFIGNIFEVFNVYPNLQLIYLSDNKLYGHLSDNWSNCKRLTNLKIARNNITDSLPSAFGGSNLVVFDVSSNIFVGEIPKEFGKLKHLLSEEKESKAEEESDEQSLFSISSLDGRAMYNEIIKATNDFDVEYCIGKGGFRVIYKVKMQSANVVAVKKLHSLSEIVDRNAFENEVKALTQIRHRNIEEAKKLTWQKRVNIIKGVVQALSYMHHDCSPPIVHHDISSNNILLDSEYEACVSDFGTAKILKLDTSN